MFMCLTYGYLGMDPHSTQLLCVFLYQYGGWRLYSEFLQSSREVWDRQCKRPGPWTVHYFTVQYFTVHYFTVHYFTVHLILEATGI
jgi:hypothetical protein